MDKCINCKKVFKECTCKKCKRCNTYHGRKGKCCNKGKHCDICDKCQECCKCAKCLVCNSSTTNICTECCSCDQCCNCNPSPETPSPPSSPKPPCEWCGNPGDQCICVKCKVCNEYHDRKGKCCNKTEHCYICDKCFICCKDRRCVVCNKTHPQLDKECPVSPCRICNKTRDKCTCKKCIHCNEHHGWKDKCCKKAILCYLCGLCHDTCCQDPKCINCGRTHPEPDEKCPNPRGNCRICCKVVSKCTCEKCKYCNAYHGRKESCCDSSPKCYICCLCYLCCHHTKCPNCGETHPGEECPTTPPGTPTPPGSPIPTPPGSPKPPFKCCKCCNDNEALSTYGEIISVTNTPIIQYNFVYGILNKDFVKTIKGDGSISSEEGMAIISSGSIPNSFSNLFTKEVITYYSGQSIDIRFSASFDEGIRGVDQYVGIGNDENGLFIGYNGREFGIKHIKGGYYEIWEIEFISSNSRLGKFKLTLNGEEIIFNLTEYLSLEQLKQMLLNSDLTNIGFKIYDKVNSIVLEYITAKKLTELFLFEDIDNTGVNIKLNKIREGVDNEVIIIKQSKWNNDKANGKDVLPKINFTLGNVYKISYQWLGFGVVKLSILEPKSGKFKLIHTIVNSNMDKLPYLAQPSGNFMAMCLNKDGSENRKLRIGSVGAFMQGINKKIGNQFQINHTINIRNRGNIEDTNDYAFVILHHNNLFNNIQSKIRVIINNIVLGNGDTSTAIFKIYKNPQISNIFNSKLKLTDINSSSVIKKYLVNMNENLIVTGDEIVFSTVIRYKKTIQTVIENNMEIIINPNDTIVLTYQVSTNNTLVSNISWNEIY